MMHNYTKVYPFTFDRMAEFIAPDISIVQQETFRDSFADDFTLNVQTNVFRLRENLTSYLYSG